MQVISVNVGQPKVVEWRGKPVETGIFKAPVAGSVAVKRLNLAGDGQADLSVHGGPEKAVYLYSAEHYVFWREQLGSELEWGAFGENLTVTGLDETNLHIGDRIGVGTTELIVTQPRMPCFKLGIRFNRADMVRRFLDSRRTGFYCSVAQEGSVAAGDPIRILARDERAVPVAEITRLYGFDRDDGTALRRVISLPALPASWRDFFREQLGRLGAAKI